jgi:hypothetical protein
VSWVTHHPEHRFSLFGNAIMGFAVTPATSDAPVRHESPLMDGTPMPWGAFARMTDDDLRAIYRYLRSLRPTRRVVGPAVQQQDAPASHRAVAPTGPRL